MMDYRNNYNNENETNNENMMAAEQNSFNGKKPSSKNKKAAKLAKKIGAIALSAVLFGGVAGGTFQAVNHFAGSTTATAATTTAQQTTSNSSLLKAAATSSSSTSTGTMDVSTIAKNAMPSIVSITNQSVQEVQNYFSMFGYGAQTPQTEETTSCGSGIIIGKNDSELLIATNNHVIDGAETVSVSFVDNETYEATIKGTDSDKDLAVVAVPLSSISSDTMSKISVATIGDSSKLEVGEQVVAIGNALGYGQSVTTGIVSATNRTLDSEDSSEASYDGISLIQTDAAINPGNSGGALLNMNGEVIGINSAKLASTEVEGMGYAISMNDAYDTIEELMNETTRTKVSDDEKASLGISGTGVSDEAAEAYGIPSGVFVSQVTEGGAAEQAGITANSIITAFDGKSVSDISELKSRLEYYKAGEEVEVTLQVPDGNGYTEKNVTVTLGKADSSTSGSSLQSGSDESQDQNQGQDPYNYGGSDDNSGNYFRFSNSQKSF